MKQASGYNGDVHSSLVILSFMGEGDGLHEKGRYLVSTALVEWFSPMYYCPSGFVPLLNFPQMPLQPCVVRWSVGRWSVFHFRAFPQILRNHMQECVVSPHQQCVLFPDHRTARPD